MNNSEKMPMKWLKIVLFLKMIGGIEKHEVTEEDYDKLYKGHLEQYQKSIEVVKKAILK